MVWLTLNHFLLLLFLNIKKMSFKQISINQWEYLQQDTTERYIEIYKFEEGVPVLFYDISINTTDPFPINLDTSVETIYQFKIDEEIVITTHSYKSLVDFFLKSSKKILCQCEDNCPEPTCEDFLKLYHIFNLLFYIPEFNSQLQEENYVSVMQQAASFTNLLLYNPQAFRRKKVTYSIKIMYSLMLKQAIFYAKNIANTKEALNYLEISKCAGINNFKIL
jgi:hypothetical protein